MLQLQALQRMCIENHEAITAAVRGDHMGYKMRGIIEMAPLMEEIKTSADERGERAGRTGTGGVAGGAAFPGDSQGSQAAEGAAGKQCRDEDGGALKGAGGH